MSTHSYSRCWLHLIWETLRREPMLDKRAAAKASVNLAEYARGKGIYMKINFFNADHTHSLIDLPTNSTIEQVVQLLKAAHRIGLMSRRCFEADLRGGAGMGPSLYRNRM